MQREVSFYQAIDHPNVIKLIAHEVRPHRGHLRAYLVFPYYQVSCVCVCVCSELDTCT